MLNLLHAINKDWGNVYFISNQNLTIVNYNGIDPTSGKPVYREASTTNCAQADIGVDPVCTAVGQRRFGTLSQGRLFSNADLQSRWQMRLGLRVSF